MDHVTQPIIGSRSISPQENVIQCMVENRSGDVQWPILERFTVSTGWYRHHGMFLLKKTGQH